jgi:hypothetical protein
LLEIVRTILAEEIRSPLLLLAKYQDRVEFVQLKQLAEQEQLLGVADLPEEYVGVIKKLRNQVEKQSTEDLKRSLMKKPLGELSKEEKQQLRELTSSKTVNY